MLLTSNSLSFISLRIAFLKSLAVISYRSLFIFISLFLEGWSLLFDEPRTLGVLEGGINPALEGRRISGYIMRTTALHVLITSLSLAQVCATPCGSQNQRSLTPKQAGLLGRDGHNRLVNRDSLFGALFGANDNGNDNGNGRGAGNNGNNQGQGNRETVTETVRQTITVNGAGAAGAALNATATMTVTVTMGAGAGAEAAENAGQDGVNANKFEGYVLAKPGRFGPLF